MSREAVEINEVGLRDGVQYLASPISTEAKLSWLASESAAGVSSFEVASFVPPKYLPQMADAAQIVAAARLIPGMKVKALVPNVKGAERAMQAGAQVLVAPVSASAAHSMANVRRSPDEMVDEIIAICRLRDEIAPDVRIEAGIATVFGCTIQGEVSEAEVRRIAATCIERGADAVGLADTVGFATPDQVRRVFRDVRSEIGDRLTLAHFHDTRGLGLVNCLAALETGIRSFDSSLGGLGGCPHAPGASGNVATEDLAFLLESLGLDTGIDLERLVTSGRHLGTLLPSETMHSRVSRAGLPRAQDQISEVA